MLKSMKLKSRFICFIGIDGSGKSTLAEMLCEDLRTNGYSVDYLWLRMNYLFTKPVLLLCRILGLTRRPIVNGRKISVHEFHRSKFIANVVQVLHSFDTFLHFVVRIYFPLKFTKKVIVCDRFIYDVFADFAIEAKNKNVFSKRVFKMANKMTKNATLLIIKVPKEEILKRKPDVIDYDLDYDLRYNLYEDIASFKEMNVVDNTIELAEVYQKVKRVVVA
ncbi:nucleoside/nucleotide kinase family protein [Pontibacter fetidus]|uniref:Thymidylate kinase n=1 Tax=Pontibacter fetidus TaxID=2700082 RepID=A0A6B2H518_9BACT|nr:hypothetical protein [Pontibacter fetidus]NDK57513.1 hypothetical protein [Pontibacter fetidus]